MDEPRPAWPPIAAGGPTAGGVDTVGATAAAGAAGLPPGRLGKGIFEGPLTRWVSTPEEVATERAAGAALAPTVGPLTRSQPLHSGQRLCTGLNSLSQAGQYIAARSVSRLPLLSPN